MKISQLSFKNVRAVPDLERPLVGPSKVPFDVVLITGPMGSGKTRMLEAIAAWKEAAGPYGAAPKLDRWERPGERGSLSGTWSLTEDEMRGAQLASASVPVRVEIGGGASAPEVPAGLRRVLSAFSREETQGKVEYFPAARSLCQAPLAVPLEALSEKVESPTRLSRDDTKYGVERAWLLHRLSADLAASGEALSGRGVLLAGQAPDSLSRARASIALLAPHLRLAGLTRRGSRPTARFVRSDRAEVELEDLSGGEQQAVLFALAFARLCLSRSVVLIDTPEMGIHPADHARFFGALTRLGEDNQIIAATCSPAILSSVPREQILDLGEKEPRK
ncbi:MAG: AAA family ATPase [Polyangiaceae bacterium]